MVNKAGLISFAFLSGLAATLAVLILMARPDASVLANPGILYVAPGGACGGANPCYESLQEAVDAASAGDLIKICTGVYTDVHSFPVPPGYPFPPVSGIVTQVVYISKTLTIRGGYSTTNWTTADPTANPTTLDALGTGRVLYVAGDANPKIEGLYMTGGDAAGLGGGPNGDSGGGILITSATLTISRNQIFSNSATWGGGLYFYNSPSAALMRNNIRNNTGWIMAGGVYFRNSPAATLVTNTIINNIADNQYDGMKDGGGVYFHDSHDASLRNNIISGNYSANHCGGGCFYNSNNAILTGNAVVSNSRQGGYQGNGIGLHFVNSKNVQLISNTISSNIGQDIDNLGTILGGGLFVDFYSTATLISNTIHSNIATRGGGLYVGNWSTVTMQFNNIAHNAVYSNLDLEGEGGGLYLANSAASLTNTVVADNQADTMGGGVYITTATFTMSNSQVFSNTARDGGGLYLDNSTDVALTGNAIISNSVTVTGSGGGLYFRNSDRALLSDNLISGNSTISGEGGGLHFENSAHATLTSNMISGNRANPFPSVGSGGWGGGAFFDDSPNATLSNNVVSDNRATYIGGLEFRYSPTPTLIANTIINNIANRTGGGMKHYGGVRFHSSDNATLINNTISGNYAANQCGGVCFIASHNATLINNAISSNHAGQPGFVVSEGGGLYLAHCTNANLISNTIEDNSTYTSGGGIYGTDSSVTLISNTIRSNAATQGGGLYQIYGDVILSRNVITANTASPYREINGEGGGLYIASGTAELSKTIVAHNQADTIGGGLYLTNSAVILTNTIVSDNKITTTSKFTSGGSGIYIEGSSARLAHATIARNGGGDGSGVYITGTSSLSSYVMLTNSILANHSAGITVAASNTAILNGVLWYNNSINTGGEGHITITNAYTGDPAFGTDGYHLTGFSEAIDKGIDAGIFADIDSEPRPMDGDLDGTAISDIGADEFFPNPGLTVIKRANPIPVRPRSLLTYTIRVNNTGNITLNATITDILPQHVTSSGLKTWSAVIPAPGGVWTQTVAVAVDANYSGPLTNIVQVTTAEGATGSASVTINAWYLYLPIALRDY